MARRKVRLTENDPLESKTDSILSSFSSKQQVNKSKSEKVENSTSQQDKLLTKEQSEFSTSQQARNITSQEDSKTESYDSNNSAREEAEKVASQQVNNLKSQLVSQSSEETTNKPSSQQPNKSASKIVSKIESQEDNKLIKLKKATYKLSEDIIERLDRAYLQMSLERGRANTPYKEVLVEEAIELFLDQLEENPDLIEQVLQRQEKRN